jgi:DNA-binding MarR family transcriptional regulator
MSELSSDSSVVTGNSVASAIDLFLAEVHGLSKTARDYAFGLHRLEGVPAGVAAVLQLLLNGGPQTVPRIGRARLTSRQNTQVLVNRMLEEGWVELIQNPAHKRSALVQLTETGNQLARAATEREVDLRRVVSPLVNSEELEQATALLARVRRTLATSPVETAPASAESQKVKTAIDVVEAEAGNTQDPHVMESGSENDFPVNLL